MRAPMFPPGQDWVLLAAMAAGAAEAAVVLDVLASGLGLLLEGDD